MPNIEDFDIIRVIGKGGFSTVFQGKRGISPRSEKKG